MQYIYIRHLHCFRCSFFKLMLYCKLFKGFPVFEIRKNLDLRKILGVTNIFLKSRFVCNNRFFHKVIAYY